MAKTSSSTRILTPLKFGGINGKTGSRVMQIALHLFF
jgi:hypothetical protein